MQSKSEPLPAELQMHKNDLEHAWIFSFFQDISHVVMEQATGKQGKDDNNIGSIISMLITDQV